MKTNRQYLLRILFAAIMFLVLEACDNKPDRFDVDLDKISMPVVTIHRYEKALFSLSPSVLADELKRIQPQFRPFLEGSTDDTLSVSKIRNFILDTALIRIYNDTRQTFPNLAFLESELSKAFRYYRYYYPNAPLPEVYTYVSGIDYQHPVQGTEEYLLIALDNYLGSDYPDYKKLGVPAYLLDQFNSKFILRDCLAHLARQYINPDKVGNSLLDRMIMEGKILWFTSALSPDMTEETLLGFNQAQLDWASTQRGLVWAFMIENEMLYSSHPNHLQKFLGKAPFTSFFGKDSPPRLGQYTGYQIVNQYMEKNSDIRLGQLMNEPDAQEILKRSGYKPSF